MLACHEGGPHLVVRNTFITFDEPEDEEHLFRTASDPLSGMVLPKSKGVTVSLTPLPLASKHQCDQELSCGMMSTIASGVSPHADSQPEPAEGSSNPRSSPLAVQAGGETPNLAFDDAHMSKDHHLRPPPEEVMTSASSRSSTGDVKGTEVFLPSQLETMPRTQGGRGGGRHGAGRFERGNKGPKRNKFMSNDSTVSAPCRLEPGSPTSPLGHWEEDGYDFSTLSEMRAMMSDGACGTRQMTPLTSLPVVSSQGMVAPMVHLALAPHLGTPGCAMPGQTCPTAVVVAVDAAQRPMMTPMQSMPGSVGGMTGPAMNMSSVGPLQPVSSVAGLVLAVPVGNVNQTMMVPAQGFVSMTLPVASGSCTAPAMMPTMPSAMSVMQASINPPPPMPNMNEVSTMMPGTVPVGMMSMAVPMTSMSGHVNGMMGGQGMPVQPMVSVPCTPASPTSPMAANGMTTCPAQAPVMGYVNGCASAPRSCTDPPAQVVGMTPGIMHPRSGTWNSQSPAAQGMVQMPVNGMQQPYQQMTTNFAQCSVQEMGHQQWNGDWQVQEHCQMANLALSPTQQASSTAMLPQAPLRPPGNLSVPAQPRSLQAGPPFGNRHCFHPETMKMGVVSPDRRQFTKQEFKGRLSVITENEVRASGVVRYLVQFMSGELSSADGVGFILSPRLPCPKNIQKIVSIFANRTGRICVRAHAEVVRSDISVKPLELGDWLELRVDLEEQVAEFTVWPMDGRPPSTAMMAYGHVLDQLQSRLPGLSRVNCGYLAVVVKHLGVSVALGS